MSSITYMMRLSAISSFFDEIEKREKQTEEEEEVMDRIYIADACSLN